MSDEKPDDTAEDKIELLPSIFEEAAAADAPAIIAETPAPETPLDMEMPAVDAAEIEMPAEATFNAPPANAVLTIASDAPAIDAAADENLSEVKNFGEKLTVGAAKVEANPAYSLKASGIRTAKAIKAVEDALANDDYGVRIEDVRVQLDTGKLLVPQISEFAAVTLAQKLREHIDEIEVGPASDIYSSSAHSIDELTSHGLTKEFDWIDPSLAHKGEGIEIHDLSNEPKSEKDVFTTNLPEMEGYAINRILSALTVSEVVDAEIAEKQDSREFEKVIEKLNKEITARAFGLGATGVVGLSFALKAIDGYRDTLGNIRRAYRVLASGTAVRATPRPGAKRLRTSEGFSPLFGKSTSDEPETET